MFIVITVKIAQIGNFHSAATVHGGAEVGSFVLMATIAASFVVSWSAYASEYSRYMKPDTSRPAIFGLTLAGDRSVVDMDRDPGLGRCGCGDERNGLGHSHPARRRCA
jgi:hypothetical protein